MIIPYPGWPWSGRRIIEIDTSLPPVSFEEWTTLYAHYRACHKAAMPALVWSDEDIWETYVLSAAALRPTKSLQSKGVLNGIHITPMGMDLLQATERSVLELGLHEVGAKELEAAAHRFARRLATSAVRDTYLDPIETLSDDLKDDAYAAIKRRWENFYSVIYVEAEAKSFSQEARRQWDVNYLSVKYRLSREYVDEYLSEHTDLSKANIESVRYSVTSPNHLARALHNADELGIRDRELRVLRAVPEGTAVPSVGIYVGGVLCGELTLSYSYDTHMIGWGSEIEIDYHKVVVKWNSPEDVREVDGPDRIYAHRLLQNRGWDEGLHFYRFAVEKDLYQSILDQFTTADIDRAFIEMVRKELTAIRSEKLLNSMKSVSGNRKIEVLNEYLELLDWEAEFNVGFMAVDSALKHLRLVELPYDYLGSYSTDAAFFLHGGKTWMVDSKDEEAMKWDLDYTFDENDAEELGRKLAIEYAARKEHEGEPLQEVPSLTPDWAWEEFEKHNPDPEDPDERYDFQHEFFWMLGRIAEAAEEAGVK